MISKPYISIVIPVFNEEQSIYPLYQRIRDICDTLKKTYEIIFVDDGSRDQTFAILDDLHRQDQKVKVIRFRKNYGQTAAMAAGFRAARGAIVLSMDGDLQNDPADIPLFLAKVAEGYDVVCGWRKSRQDKLISRRIPSLVANWLIGKMTKVPIHDNGCSLKAYRAEVIKRVALYSELHRFIPAMCALTGARVTEIVVRHHPRRFGKSKYGISRAWRVLLDLIIIKMLTRFSERPALWFGILSLPATFFALLCAVGLLIPGTSGVVLPTLVVLFTALAGHFLFVGLLGELIVLTGDFRIEPLFYKMSSQVHGKMEG